ncbi:ArsR/SmtB family transcription factor [Paenibacillus ehimensis]|uniref:Metalloregulator ArsR/SmtB family transcription factor n=1 Tax=Paenibacillus ehimensis TaxID=79264 RepID=A0ABT8VBP2_9BACL|nr:metalloregulator ArsR/SmtB family transcription factor [Paenibacillus ehimensis]MDO3678424.1 metalloregulator ArsR/SmtB family transcription factor [Paenibacillus ehimensis]MEC0211604.1 metalloregulator ArsR/SmtB family transcription factor [Paenibacillus ehimensis]
MPVDIFSALADPTRRKIVEMLAENDRCPASEIHKQFSVSPQAISQHLKILLEANVISVEKKAQQRIYRLNTRTMTEFEEWSRQVRLKWSRRLNAMDAVLRAEMEKMKQNQEPKEHDDEPKS